jgi:hypothetical protein
MESNYKNLKYDWQNNVEKIEDVQDRLIEDENSTKFRGTKGLMSLVQGYIDNANNKQSDDSFEDTESDEQ